MVNGTRYRKPNMTNLPRELGVNIFKQILKSPVPDREKMRNESKYFVNENLQVRKKEIAQGNSAE